VLGGLARTFVGSDRTGTKENGESAKNQKGSAGSDAATSRGAKLLFCVIGIQLSYLSWGGVRSASVRPPFLRGALARTRLTRPACAAPLSARTVMQERIMTQPYGEEKESFNSSKFLVFTNRLVALVAADVVLAYMKSGSDGTPPFRFSFCATSNILSSVCQYDALKYVSFPTQVLAKSCKMVPVMLMGYVVSRKSYPLLDWIVALAVTGGVLMFKLNEASGKAKGGTSQGGSEMLGYVLIAGYMAFDSFTSNWQEALFKEYPAVSPVQMMRQVNLFSATFTFIGLLLTSEALTMPAFLARHPDCAMHIAFMSITSAVGQLFIFYTIKQFGALMFATINAVRTLLSVILSFLIFSHAVNAGEAMGIATVFAALGLQVVVKWTRKAVKSPALGK
jgi:adenosine 3'-phospho 5'-phosphosulfate transporter B2